MAEKQRVEVVLNTFADIAKERKGGLQEWLVLARTTLLDRFFDHLKTLQPEVIPAAPVTSWGRPGEAWFSLGYERRSHHTRIVDFNEKNWLRCLRMLEGEELLSLTITGAVLDDEATSLRAPAGYEVYVDLRNLEWPHLPHQLTFWLSDSLWSVTPEQTQRDLVHLLREGAVVLGSATGYIDRGETSLSRSLYEDKIGATEGRQRCREWLRGPFWSNILTSGHVDKLGGHERVMQDAPCEVRELLSLEPLYVHLQATEMLDSFDAEARRQLERYLEPILPARSRIEKLPDSPAWLAVQETTAAHMEEVLARLSSSENTPVPSPPPSSDASAFTAPFPFEIADELDITALRVALEFEERLRPEHRDAIGAKLTEWYETGVAGGWGGFLHWMSEPWFEDGETGTRAEWTLDLGSASDAAVQALLDTLGEFAERRGAGIGKLTID